MNAVSRPVAFVLASTTHGTMITNRNDYCVIDDAHSYGVGFQLLSTSGFDTDEVHFLQVLLQMRRRYFGDGVLAIDCGANIGVHTIEWARTMHGWGEVIAFEAQERVYYALAGNVVLNNCFNARAFWSAIGAAPGTITVPTPDYQRPGSFGSLELRQGRQTEFIGQPIDYAHGVTTPLTSLDALGIDRVDLIKIDVEGMELEVLAGAEQLLRRCHPQLLVEIIKTDKAAVSQLLEGLGYRLYPMGINLLAIHQTDPTTDHVSVANGVINLRG